MVKKWLLGGLVGLLSSTHAFAYAGLYIAPSVAYQDISSNSTSYDGIAPKVAGGLNVILQNGVYLAGEIFVTPASITISDSKNDAGQNLKMKYSVGASILPGFDIDGTIIGFLRGGIAYSHFEQVGTQKGYQVGGGVEYRIDDDWSVRGEYIYTGYSSTHGLTPRNQEAILGFVYRFTSH